MMMFSHYLRNMADDDVFSLFTSSRLELAFEDEAEMTFEVGI